MANNKVLPDFYKCWTETVIEPQTFQIKVCTSVGKGGAESATLCQESQATLIIISPVSTDGLTVLATG